MIKKLTVLSLCVTSTFFSALSYGESAIRVSCYEDNEGAKVFINDKFRGNCPVDLFVPGGNIKLKAVKEVDQDRARFFHSEFYLPDDSAKSVEVLLLEPQITRAGVERQRKQRLAEEKRIASDALKRARQGDVAAMDQMVEFYTKGQGVSKNADKAAYWQDKSSAIRQQRYAGKVLAEAQSRDIDAMEELAELYRSGKGVEKDLAEAARWDNNLLVELRTMASQGDSDAMRKLSEVYTKGEIIEKDDALAEEWAARAMAHDNAEQERVAKLQKDNETREKIAKIDYFEFTQGAFKSLGRQFDDDGPIVAISSVTIMAVGLGSDLVSAPSNTSSHISYQMDLSARPAEWNNPDSMIAKANRQRQNSDPNKAWVASAD